MRKGVKFNHISNNDVLRIFFKLGHQYKIM